MIDPFRLESLLRAEYTSASQPWEAAFVACATGDFESAVSTGEPWIEDEDEEVRAQARLTVGSALRQLHQYERAQTIERTEDLEQGPGRDHLLVSNAANHVGLADAAAAQRLLDQVRSSDRRVQIRRSWVACEIALLNNDPHAALSELLETDAASSGWPRHEAKTALFLGVAHWEAGNHEQSISNLDRARSIAARIGARPIEEVAQELLNKDVP